MSTGRESLPGQGAQCIVHGAEIAELKEGQREIMATLNGTLQAPGIRTDVAMVRQDVAAIREELRASRPAAGAVWLAIYGAVLTIVAGVTVYELTQARAQAQATHQR